MTYSQIALMIYEYSNHTYIMHCRVHRYIYHTYNDYMQLFWRKKSSFLFGKCPEKDEEKLYVFSKYLLDHQMVLYLWFLFLFHKGILVEISILSYMWVDLSKVVLSCMYNVFMYSYAYDLYKLCIV